MTAPFSSALSTAFTFSFIACLVAAGASWLRGGKFHYQEEPDEPRPASAPPASEPVGARQSGGGSR